MKLFPKLKSIGSILISILLCVGLIAVPFIATAEETNDYNEDYFQMSSVEEMYLAYHVRINNLFNDAIRKNLELGDEAVVTVSKDDAEQNAECENAENLSTICIGLRAMYEYHGYQLAMTAAKDTTSLIPLFKDAPKAKQQVNAASLIGGKNEFIDREIGVDGEPGRALASQEATLDFYTEFMGAHQMHTANEKLIKSLEKYNKKLGKFRTQLHFLPPKFHNVTTDGGGCT